MMSIGSIIKSRRKELGLTLEEVGRAVGVGKSTVRKWETGYIENMRRDKIPALAKILALDPSIFIGQSTERRYPLLGKIACGEPIFVDEEYESFVSPTADIDADFCLRCQGDSMIGARILDGDIVFIRSQSTVENGEIAAVIIEDEATLKRVQYFPEKNMLILKPENPKFSDLVYAGEELARIRILGKAVAFFSAVK